MMGCGRIMIGKSDTAFTAAADTLMCLTFKHLPVVMRGSHVLAIGEHENISRKEQAMQKTTFSQIKAWQLQKNSPLRVAENILIYWTSIDALTMSIVMPYITEPMCKY
jgi:hypothetical protein